jgi:hypothetical protein
MATKYYANVRRYQDEHATLSVATLSKNTLLTAANVKTNTKFYVYYIIDIYASNIQTFADWQTAFKAGTQGINGKGILVSSEESTNRSNNLGSGLTTNITASANTSSAQANFVTVGALTNDNSHNKVSFSRKSGATNTQVVATPTLAIQWKSDLSPNWTKITDIYWGTTGNKTPSITWTTVVTSPEFPLVAIQVVLQERYGESPILQDPSVSTPNKIAIKNNFAWDKCTNLFNFIVQYKTAQYGGNGSQELWTCTKNGDLCHSNSGTPGADILADKKKLKVWLQKNVTDKLIAAKSNAACGDGTGGGGTQKDVADVTPPAGTTRWNPPPHRGARDISHAERLQYADNAVFNTVTAFDKKERGRIYQDINGAATLNKNPSGIKDLNSAKGTGNLWGFRFMYNPTTFGYSTSSNNSVDWTLGASDPAVLLAGNQTVSFEVYINRIPDLKYLRMKNPPASQEFLYGRKLDTTEVEGILNRGTEYDIEFLYRVLNGDPLQKSLLLNYNGVTADFGYTTAVPCWLVLNENLRYFGSVASFQVNHAMFDSNMVPMLSTVNISFTRYPALWNQTGADIKSSVVSANAIHNYLASTGTTSGTTDTAGVQK